MGEFINVLVSKGKSNLIPEKDNLYGQFVGEWDFEWVDNQGTTGERHVQGEWIFAWVLEGTAIQDVFICPSRKARIKDYQPDAAYATAVRMYNPNTEAWDILYTELGGATQLEGSVLAYTGAPDRMIKMEEKMITSLYQSLCNMETNIADRVALRWYDEKKQGVAEVHYAQYAQDLRRFVAFLRAEYGDVRGKRVAILARNSYQYVICMYGTAIAGAVAVPEVNMIKAKAERSSTSVTSSAGS